MKAIIRHGTITGYAADLCRCDACRKAAAAYRKTKSAEVNAAMSADPDHPFHGTLNGATNGKCKCARCRDAANEAARRRRRDNPPPSRKLHGPKAPIVVRLRNNLDDPRHGTHSGYQAGCRCDRCTAANTEQHLIARAERYATPKDPDDPRHGTTSFYNNFGCRCDRCVAVYSVRNRQQRERRKARKATS